MSVRAIDTASLTVSPVKTVGDDAAAPIARGGHSVS